MTPTYPLRASRRGLLRHTVSRADTDSGDAIRIETNGDRLTRPNVICEPRYRVESIHDSRHPDNQPAVVPPAEHRPVLGFRARVGYPHPLRAQSQPYRSLGTPREFQLAEVAVQPSVPHSRIQHG